MAERVDYYEALFARRAAKTRMKRAAKKLAERDKSS